MFTVVFQTGGRDGLWRKALPVATLAEAAKQAATVQRMGYPAIVQTTEFWNVIGLPEGESLSWDYKACKPI